MTDSRAILETNILPWWETNGVDEKNGGVFTCFANNGRLLSTDKIIWSQGRWAWLCAQLGADIGSGILTGDGAEWTSRARTTSAFILEHAILDGPVTAFRVSAEGGPPLDGEAGHGSSVLADLYAALGLAGGAGTLAEGDREHWASTALALLANAERRVASRTAPSEPYPVRPGFTDAASLMLLLHVGAEIHKVTRCEVSAATVDRAMLGFFGTTPGSGLWQPGHWWEFRPDEVDDCDTLLARHVTPGHLLEALWMAADACPTPLPDWIPDLALQCLELGWDTWHGGLFRYVDRFGRHTPNRPVGRLFGGDAYESLVQQTWDTKLWWVHVEAMYATRLLAERSGRRDLMGWHERVTEYTLGTFPCPDGQEWLQIRDRKGNPLDKVVALPVKDPFHIARALLLLNRLDST